MTHANRTAAALDKSTLRELRQRAHALKPIVRLGQHGLSDAVCAELDMALAHHELVKVKLAADDKPAREVQLQALLTASGAQLVQRIGHTATLWRRKPDTPKAATTQRTAVAARRRPVTRSADRTSSRRRS